MLQVSLLERLDPEQHLKMGTALEKVAQEQDVLIVCSGQVCGMDEVALFELLWCGRTFCLST